MEAPIFILSMPRSGSTMLRRLIDTHPSVACLPETDLVLLFWQITTHLSETQRQLGLPAPDSPFAPDDLCRALAESVHGAHAKRSGATRWLDKSLTSAHYPELLLRIFPDAQFICLFRDSRDTVASLLEATPFGYTQFGVEPYVRANPGNLLEALALYWVDTTGHILDFSSKHPRRVHELRYEDLVADTAGEMVRLAEFLSIDSNEFELEAAFGSDADVTRSRVGDPLGDYKFEHTAGVESGSVGRGATLPFELISAGLSERLDHLNTRLGYRAMNEFPMVSELFGYPDRDLGVIRGVRVSLPVDDSRAVGSSDDLSESDDEFTSLFAAGMRRLRTMEEDSAEAVSSAALGVVGVHISGVARPWILDFEQLELRREAERCRSVVLADGAAVMAVAHGWMSPAVMRRRGLLRVLIPAGTEETEDGAVRRYVQQAIAGFLALIAGEASQRSNAEEPVVAIKVG